MNRLPSHSLVAQTVKNLTAMQGSGVQSPGQKDPLEKEIAHTHKHTHTPLQYSCLGNPMDRGAWQATVHEVVKALDVT